jgi:hypothetical protein
MLKHGICTLEQLDRSGLERLAETQRFFHRFCDIALYEAPARRGGSGDEALQAAVLNLFPMAMPLTSAPAASLADLELWLRSTHLFDALSRSAIKR